jgi:hypothetical protein
MNESIDCVFGNLYVFVPFQPRSKVLLPRPLCDRLSCRVRRKGGSYCRGNTLSGLLGSVLASTATS